MWGPPARMDHRGSRRSSSSSSSAMERRLRKSSLRFHSAMSDIMEKYNFPFDDDLIISIKSLMYDTPNGPKVWGEETEDEVTDISYQNTVQCQEDTETQIEQTSEFENADSKDCQSSDEEEFMNSCGKGHLEETDHKSNAELASIRRDLEKIHFKVIRTKEKNVNQESLPEMKDEFFDHRGVVLRKGAQPLNRKHPPSLQLCNSAAPSPTERTIVPVNQSVWNNSEASYSRFLEMYESADEHCSWANVTISDLYPGMVKTLSRLMRTMPHIGSSGSFAKRYKYGYWHPKKTKCNTTIEKVRQFRPLQLKSSLTSEKRHKLAIANCGSKGTFEDGSYQNHCSVNDGSSVITFTNNNEDRMEMNYSGIVKDHSYTEKIFQNGMDVAFVPNDLSKEETFLLKRPSCIPSASAHVRKRPTFNEFPSTLCAVDSGATFHLVEDKTDKMSTLAFEAASCLNLSLNSDTNSCFQSMPSQVESSNAFLGNHEIKIFSTAISLQRSHSFSLLPTSQNRIKAHQKCEDAFEKMYKELCSPKLQKPFTFAKMSATPWRSEERLLKPVTCASANSPQKHNTFESIYRKLCSEGAPQIPTFLRAASLKKYQGIQMSDTVNALVNSPMRTLPADARIKRAADLYSEDFQSSPIKRLKNMSENFSSRVNHKPSIWNNVNLHKTNMTFMVHSQNTNNWTPEKLDSGFCVPSNSTFLAEPSTYLQESGVVGVYENGFGYLGKPQHCRRGFILPTTVPP